MKFRFWLEMSVATTVLVRCEQGTGFVRIFLRAGQWRFCDVAFIPRAGPVVAFGITGLRKCLV